MASIQILLGSVMGTAEQVAAAVAEALRELGHDVSVNPYGAVSDILAAPDDILLLCTSNTGAGDLPDNILPLYMELTRDYPLIAGRRFGAINLGDSSYATFNEGGRALTSAFEDLGARQVGTTLVIDASEGEDPEAVARAWISAWATEL
jgi:MioC protein